MPRRSYGYVTFPQAVYFLVACETWVMILNYDEGGNDGREGFCSEEAIQSSVCSLLR